VPEFFGQKGKDNITVIVFIRRIDNLARTNNWSNTVTYTNVANTLRGFAHDWLFATIELLDWEGDQLTWTNLKPRFQQQFATQSDNKRIIDGFSNLAMKLNKLTGELLARITNTMFIIKESYATYKNKVAAPANHDSNSRYLEATATKWRNDSVNNAMQFCKMLLFWAALPGDLRKVVSQHDQNTMTLDDMYQIATTTQREEGAKMIRPITTVDKNSQSDTENDNNKVAAFQNRKSMRFAPKNKKQFTAPTCPK
jgi:hypothetical protein